METRLITIPEAAQWLGSSVRTVRRLIEAGALPTIQLRPPTGHPKIAIADLEEFVRKQRRAGHDERAA